MGDWLERAWRTVATGVCFLVFGLGGLALGFIYFPLLRALVREPSMRVDRSRRLVWRFFRFFVWLMSRLGVLSYEVHGGERLGRPGLLVVANHPTLIDIIFLVALMPRANCVVIFPEGTRSPRSGPLTLQRGAAHVAIRGRRPLTPVVILCEPPMLGKGEKWYRVPSKKVHFTLRVHDDIQVEPFLENASAPIAVRRLNDYLKSFFEEATGRAAA
jgi:1-acyl-sn-glycerol-3-phosphate acyltransferase